MAAQVSEGQNEEKVSPATGKALKKHEKWGLKGVPEEQQAKFWEAVIYWSKERFSEAKWREVVRRIERVREEDNVIVFGWHPPPRPVHSIITTGGRQLLHYSSSSLTSPTGAHPLRPAHLPRIATSSSTTPRPRWDIVLSGPVTPLSAASGSFKNAFAEGGFWASLTPKTSFTAGSTPTTAANFVPWVPEIPRAPEAKAAYGYVKKDVNKMALQLCASRLAFGQSFHGEGDVVHQSMVKPKDELQAAEFILESRQLDLSKCLNISLLDKVEHFADEEAACLRQYSIPTAEKLEDTHSWLQFDERSGDLTNILEAQRHLFRMNSDRRQNKDIQLSEQALQLAWAVKIVDDAENLVQSWADAESADSDEDQGYDYSNFLRSIRSQNSSDLRANAEKAAYDKFGSVQSSNPTNHVHATIANHHHHGQTRTSQRSNSSPITSAAASSPYAATLPLRARHATHSTTHKHPSTTTTTISRPSNATAHRKNLRIMTTGPAPSLPTTTISPPAMSPEERGFRHQGPSIEDLRSWANELRAMETKRAERKSSARVVALGYMRGIGSTAATTTTTTTTTTATATTNTSKKNSSNRWSARHTTLPKDMMIQVHGSIHPAFRTDATVTDSTGHEEPLEAGRGVHAGEAHKLHRIGRACDTTNANSSTSSSSSSSSSWVCETAAEMERQAPLFLPLPLRLPLPLSSSSSSSSSYSSTSSRPPCRLSLRTLQSHPVAPGPPPAPYNRLAPTSLQRRAAANGVTGAGVLRRRAQRRREKDEEEEEEEEEEGKKSGRGNWRGWKRGRGRGSLVNGRGGVVVVVVVVRKEVSERRGVERERERKKTL